MVSALARRMIRDPHEAEESAQETWLQVLQGLPSFRGESSISTWIFAVARRVILRHAARNRVYRFRELSGYFHGEERLASEAGGLEQEVWARQECDRCLTGMLHCLGPEDRLIFILRDMARLDYARIAGVMEKAEPAVRKSASRSRACLGRFLRRECVLANPASRCRCRMAARVEEVDLPASWRRLRRMVGQAGVWGAAEALLPRANAWEKMLP